MATVTALTAARANTAVASAAITNGNLILTKLDGSTVNVGAVGGSGGSGATNAWLTGTTDPSSGTGVDGDWYLTSTTGKILQKVAGSWVTKITSIIGTNGSGGSSNLETAFPVTLGKQITPNGSIAPAGSNSVPIDYMVVPYAFTLLEARAYQKDADPSTATLIDVHIGSSGSNTTVLGTRIQIDAAERSSTDSATQSTIGTSIIPVNSELWFYLDQRGDLSRGVTVILKGTRNLVTSSSAVPSAPTNLTNTAVTNTSATYTWTLPADNGVALIRQEVEWKRSSETYGNNPVTIGATTTTYSPGAFTAGDLVDFRVRGVNSNNAAGPWAERNNVQLTGGAATAPAAPPINLPLTLTSTTATMTWSAPANNGSAITGYQVEWALNAGSFANSPTSIGASPLSHTFTGLTPGSVIQVRVRAINGASPGIGPYATTQNITLPSGTPAAPSAPTNLTNTGTLAPNMGFSWTLPVANNDPLIRQEVDWKQSAAAWGTSPATITTSATTYAFGGTVSGQTFDFRVRGVSNTGPGPWATLTNITATASGSPAVPSAPTNLVNTSTVAPNMGFSWTIPATNNDPLTRQEVEWKQSASAWADVNTDKLTTDNSHVFGGTVSGQSFDFRVRGVSNLGNGPWATISNIVATTQAATARSIAPSTTNWANISYDTNPGGTWPQATQLANGLGAVLDTGSPTFRPQIYQGSVFDDQPYFGSTQAFVQFDTAVGGTLTPGSAELRMYLANDNSTASDFTVDVYLYDYGTIAETDMRTSSQIAVMTKIGHFASLGIGATNALKTMTITNRTAFEAAINTSSGGTLRLLFVNQLFQTASPAGLDVTLGLNFNRANSRLEFTS
jgi:hypothetical protein